MARALSTEPSPRQIAMLRVIALAVADGMPAPSHVALAKACGFSNPGSTRCHLAALERFGLLGRTAANARFFVPTARGWQLAEVTPPADVPALLPADAPIAAAVREAFAAGEPLPPRVVAAIEAVPV